MSVSNSYRGNLSSPRAGMINSVRRGVGIALSAEVDIRVHLDNDTVNLHVTCYLADEKAWRALGSGSL